MYRCIKSSVSFAKLQMCALPLSSYYLASASQAFGLTNQKQQSS